MNFLRIIRITKFELFGAPKWLNITSELVDDIEVAECSGNTHYRVLFWDIQGKYVGQISK